MTSLCLLLVSGLLSAADAPGADAIAQEWKRLDGAWELVLPEGDMSQPFRLEIAERKGTVIFNPTAKVAFKLSLDISTAPACLDIDLQEQKIVFEAIYKVENDTLTVCLSEANVRERPTRFPEKTEGNQRLFVFRRLKP
jgi:uncharacterized protein (TIGR03067 family)